MQTIKLLKSAPITSNYGCLCNFFDLNSIYAQSLRWKRKPIWLPTAKTKVFRIHPRPQIPEDEYREIQRLYNNYRTYIKSMMNHFKEQRKINEIETDQSVLDKEEESDYNKCMELNNEWNKQIAVQRDERRTKELEERKAKILENKLIQKQIEEKIISQVDEKVKEMISLEPTFITRDNIDQAIEEALSNIADYNKALTIDGEWYTDTSGLPLKHLSEKQKSVNS